MMSKDKDMFRQISEIVAGENAAKEEKIKAYEKVLNKICKDIFGLDKKTIEHLISEKNAKKAAEKNGTKHDTDMIPEPTENDSAE